MGGLCWASSSLVSVPGVPLVVKGGILRLVALLLLLCKVVPGRWVTPLVLFEKRLRQHALFGILVLCGVLRVPRARARNQHHPQEEEKEERRGGGMQHRQQGKSQSK